MIKNIIPINRPNSIPIIEFADNLENGKVVVSGGTDGKSKLLTFSSTNVDCKVGDVLDKADVTPIFGLLFYKDESIDILIRRLKELKKIKLQQESEE